jgi:hypothetical protein
VTDPIAPPAARRPDQAVELVSLAISDGDLEAALAQYERGAALRPWASQRAADGAGLSIGARDAGDDGNSGIREMLLGLMLLRIPLSVRVRAVLPAGGLALVLAERQLAAVEPDLRPIRLRGLGSTVLRRQPRGDWRIVAEAWCLDGAAGTTTSPELPPSLRRIPRAWPAT